MNGCFAFPICTRIKRKTGRRMVFLGWFGHGGGKVGHFWMPEWKAATKNFLFFSFLFFFFFFFCNNNFLLFLLFLFSFHFFSFRFLSFSFPLLACLLAFFLSFSFLSFFSFFFLSFFCFCHCHWNEKGGGAGGGREGATERERERTGRFDSDGCSYGSDFFFQFQESKNRASSRTSALCTNSLWCSTRRAPRALPDGTGCSGCSASGELYRR